MGRSWQLFNINTGDFTMERGNMDIAFDNGTVIEVPGPEAIVAQRVEKSSVEPQFSNRFSPGWGSVFALLLGRKLNPIEIARDIGTSMRLMIAALIVEQNRVSRSVPLVPAEMISSLEGVQVASDVDTITIGAQIALGTGTSVSTVATVSQ